MIVEEVFQNREAELDKVFLESNRPLRDMHADAIEEPDLGRPIDRNREKCPASNDLPLLADELELELLLSVEVPEHDLNDVTVRAALVDKLLVIQ